MVRDVGLAEELAQDACVIALSNGRNPASRTIPVLADGRGQSAAPSTRARRNRMLGASTKKSPGPGGCVQRRGRGHRAAMDDDVGDELLSLIFLPAIRCCHRGTRGADACLVGGLTTGRDRARLPLQRRPLSPSGIVRAKRTLGDAGLSFELPRGKEREQRLASVLEVSTSHLQRGLRATAG